MQFLNKDNIYNYTFPKIALDIASYHKPRASLAILASYFNMTAKTVVCKITGFTQEYDRILYLDIGNNILLKRMKLGQDLECPHTCPTIVFKNRVGGDFYIQPICDLKTRPERSKLALELSKLYKNNDIHSSNVGWLNGLPTLIDW